MEKLQLLRLWGTLFEFFISHGSFGLGSGGLVYRDGRGSVEGWVQCAKVEFVLVNEERV